MRGPVTGVRSGRARHAQALLAGAAAVTRAAAGWVMDARPLRALAASGDAA